MARRCSLLKALTIDFDEFYRRYDSEKKRLRLFGYPDQKLKSISPSDVVPENLSTPSTSIRIRKKARLLNQWLYMLATHSLFWLYSVAYYSLSRSEFIALDGEQYINMISTFPSVWDVVLVKNWEEFEENLLASIRKPEPKLEPKLEPKAMRKSKSKSKSKSKLKSKSKRGDGKCDDTRMKDKEAALTKTLLTEFHSMTWLLTACVDMLFKDVIYDDSDHPSEGEEMSNTEDVNGLNVLLGKATIGMQVRMKRGNFVCPEPFVRDDNCADLASDPRMGPNGAINMTLALPCTR